MTRGLHSLTVVYAGDSLTVVGTHDNLIRQIQRWRDWFTDGSQRPTLLNICGKTDSADGREVSLYVDAAAVMGMNLIEYS